MTSDNTGFDFTFHTRLVFGSNSIDRLGELARECGAGRVLLVTDAGLVAAGHVDHARQSLERAGLALEVFDDVHENPTTQDVDRCVEVARAAGIDVIIGLGGGSSLDTAKGCNFLLTNGGRMQDYVGTKKAALPMLPMIAVPTTAGTGSECQSFALIADEHTHHKMACGDPKAAPRVALLDPALTISQPRSVTACTGIDALAHAIETAVTRRRNPLSDLYSRRAYSLIMGNLERVLYEPDDLNARAAMQLGAAFAGIAIEASMLGAVHSAANPLTAHFGLAHGQAVGLMLPAVLLFNAEEAGAAEVYRELAVSAGLVLPGAPASEAVPAMAQRIRELLRHAGIMPPPELNGAMTQMIPTLAREAAAQWTARYNPRTITEANFAALFHSTFGAPGVVS